MPAPFSPSPQPPQAQGQARPAQPPFGSSPATGPTENRGQMVSGIKMMGMALLALERSLPLVGAASEPGRDVLKAINTLSKHVPPGSVTPTDIQNSLQKLMIEQQQFGQQMTQMRQQAAQSQSQSQPGGGASQMPHAA